MIYEIIGLIGNKSQVIGIARTFSEAQELANRLLKNQLYTSIQYRRAVA